MYRRQTGPQVAAVMASLSINALLLLALRQVGSVPADGIGNDGDAAPLLVVDLPAVRPRKPATVDRRRASRRPAARTPGRAAAGHAAPGPRASADAQPARLRIVTGDDRWDRRDASGASHDAFQTAFQRSLDDHVPDPRRRSPLAGLAFRDSSFGGLMARLTQGADCRDLEVGLRKHPESAEVIMRTMQRVGCRP